VAATAELDVGVVLAGDGPARADLQARAADRENVRFLGFLDREELATFYSTLDVFAFPSPVETQGLVALESIACGTPVVAVDSGALSESIDDGTSGYHYQPGDIEGEHINPPNARSLHFLFPRSVNLGIRMSF